MNHCRLVTISSGRLPFSKNLTGWVMGRGSPMSSPDSLSSSTILVWAAPTFAPGAARTGPSSRPGRRVVDAPVPPDDGVHGQVQLPPPDDVGDVAERADHGDARALLGVGQRVGDDRDGLAEQRAWWPSGRRAAGSACRRGGRRGRRRRRAARAGWCRCRAARRRGRGSAGGGRRRAAPGPPARPGRPRSGSRRPTGWAPRPGRRGLAAGGGGTPSARCAGPARRWSCRSASSRRRGRGCGTAPRTPARPRP